MSRFDQSYPSHIHTLTHITCIFSRTHTDTQHPHLITNLFLFYYLHRCIIILYTYDIDYTLKIISYLISKNYIGTT